MSRLWWVSLLVPSVALAVPLRMSHQGRVLEAGGDPVTGAHSLTFALYGAATGGTALWTETDALTLDNGYFATILGDGTPLDLDALGGDLWLGIRVDAGTELAPRQPLASAPYALVAQRAVDVVGGRVEASEIVIDGRVVIDGDGNAVGLGGSLDQMVCLDGEILRYDGGWVCDADGSLTDDEIRDIVEGAPLALAAGSTVGGTAISTLTTAGVRADLSGSPVSLAAGTTVGGATASTLTVAQVRTNLAGSPVELGAGSTIGGVAVATAADLPDSGDLAGALDGVDLTLGPGTTLDGLALATIDDLDFALADQTCTIGTMVTGVGPDGLLSCGPVQVPDAAACGQGDVGVMQFDPQDRRLQICTGAGWVSVVTTATIELASGARRWTDGTYGADCDAYRHPGVGYAYEGTAATSGTYWIDPLGDDPFQAWCDMDFDGGGWTKVMSIGPGTTNLGVSAAVSRNGTWTTAAKGTATGKVSNAEWAALWSQTKFLMRVEGPSDGKFIGNGAGFLVWTAGGAPWAQWGTSQRPTSYALQCDRTGDGVIDQTETYTSSGDPLCLYGTYWLHDHFSGRICYGFGASQLHTNIHFCGASNGTQSDGGVTGTHHIYVRN